MNKYNIVDCNKLFKECLRKNIDWKEFKEILEPCFIDLNNVKKIGVVKNDL